MWVIITFVTRDTYLKQLKHQQVNNIYNQRLHTSPRLVTMFVGVVALYHAVLITECHNSHKHRILWLTIHMYKILWLTYIICLHVFFNWLYFWWYLRSKAAVDSVDAVGPSWLRDGEGDIELRPSLGGGCGG